MNLYHGSAEKFDHFKQPITWLTDSYDYALEFSTFAADDSYIYTCEISDNLKLLDCGNTSVNCYSIFPITPYKLSPNLNKIVDKLKINEDEIRAIISEVAADFDEPRDGYAMRLHVLTRSTQFRDLLISKGYDGVKCIEQGYNTWGIFYPNLIKIIDVENLADSSNTIEQALRALAKQK